MFFDEDLLKLELDSIIEEFQSYTNTLRTGRPNIEALGKIIINYYGEPTQLNSLSQVSADALTATIKLFDKSTDAIKSTEKALNESSVVSGNINQSEQGVFKINFPPLTTETRISTVKELKEKLEKEFIRKARQIRQEERDKLKKLEKVPEDEVKRDEEKIQKMLDSCLDELNNISTKKEIDIMTV